MAAKPSSRNKGFADTRYRALVARLVDARKAAGFSQTALAKLLGRHQQFVSRYEIGERRLDAVEFIDIARALDLDAGTLLSEVPISR
ncbi:helix-turn-helix domain-containing protein [Sphingomonas sp. SAFR-052]|uniref:helix-turn-helix domain-containing protein n=1 Tax=Sphingomonas sp. SAFR-052 TaxID=3436867 RepID=UPI003F80088C